MEEDLIDYGKLIDDAMHLIVKQTLEIVVERGLPNDHHFFISFLTNYPGVSLSPKLKEKYPEEMTIVLQYQFEDLVVEKEHFEVTLSFDNQKERVVVPFSSLTAFADPSVKFGLQFRYVDDPQDDEDAAHASDFMETVDDASLEGTDAAYTTDSSASDGSNVITLDHFRKK